MAIKKITALPAVTSVAATDLLMVGNPSTGNLSKVAASNLFLATGAVVDSLSYGTVGDGVADDTAALQAFLNASTGRAHLLRTPTVKYRTTSTLTIPDAPGFHLLGESRISTVIEADFSNSPILKTSGQFQHSYHLGHFQLRYKTAQASTNTNATALMIDGLVSDEMHFYLSTIEHLKIAGAYKGIAVKQYTGEIQDVWNCTFRNLDFDDISGSLINLRSAITTGMPINTFEQIRCIQLGAPHTNTQPTLVVDGEYSIDGLDVEDWHGMILESLFGIGTIRGVHIERHHIADNERLFTLYGDSYMIDQYVIDYAAAAGTSYIFWMGGGADGGTFHLGTGHVTSAVATAGASLALLIVDTSVSVPTFDVPMMPTYAGSATWNGLYHAGTTAPVLVTDQTIRAQSGSAYTVVAADAGKLLRLTGTATVTLPSGALSVGQRVDFFCVGGVATFALGSGATWDIAPTPSAVARAVGSFVSAVKMGATTWALAGDLA